MLLDLLLQLLLLVLKSEQQPILLAEFRLDLEPRAVEVHDSAFPLIELFLQVLDHAGRLPLPSLLVPRPFLQHLHLILQHLFFVFCLLYLFLELQSLLRVDSDERVSHFCQLLEVVCLVLLYFKYSAALVLRLLVVCLGELT